ncbi:putative serine/threonine-protein kinase pbl3, partial [Quercus suber]
IQTQLLCYSVLKAATQKFSCKNLLGQGGFGDVYIGYINHCTMTAARPGGGYAVAVKRLRKKGTQGDNEWLNELKFLARLNHPNVVKLIGYCSEREHRILVYEYMIGGSLEAHLLKDDDAELNWRRRINIALGAAKGLNFLHTLGRPVIHRDVKASNVLLDAVSFCHWSLGFTRQIWTQGDQSHVSSRILGTKGYFAPECIGTGHLTLKTDVYSFGVVLLEIFSGNCAAKKYSNGLEGNLVQWAKPYLSNKQDIRSVIDKRIGENFPGEGAQEFARIILQCLCTDPTGRPEMREVVANLERLEKICEAEQS